MLTINEKIGIEWHHVVMLVNLGHPHDARIRKRHRPIRVLAIQPVKLRDMITDLERDLESAISRSLKSAF
jgi:hypothetical protein